MSGDFIPTYPLADSVLSYVTQLSDLAYIIEDHDYIYSPKHKGRQDI